MQKLKDLWARLKVRWHIVALAFLTALPELLDWLGMVDLKPLLSHFLPDGAATLIVSLLPFVLVFTKSMVHVEDDK
ncbi:hypothetical protein [Bradyrhizobium sp. BR 10289]|uniref:hypothetical protein n=1 Tax=Bradyrhizobium sp. BR 10289 TaxID=2749993 RepID=UPI001C6541C7|nr:hypothetical protein [Bradyrhizobium sp. BR 10289]MBW7970961.1 hypothetical protein [Bradyrhizobium sp. BR 10289]